MDTQFIMRDLQLVVDQVLASIQLQISHMIKIIMQVLTYQVLKTSLEGMQVGRNPILPILTQNNIHLKTT